MREPGDQRAGGPRRAGELLRGLLAGLQPVAQAEDLQRSLEGVLGYDSAELCRIRGYRAGTLVVEVDSAPLLAELSGFRSEEIRSAMNAVMAKHKIARIRFRMGGTGHV